MPFPFFNIRTMSKASIFIADAILGEDTVAIIVSVKVYSVSPPTIIKLVKAANTLIALRRARL